MLFQHGSSRELLKELIVPSVTHIHNLRPKTPSLPELLRPVLDWWLQSLVEDEPRTGICEPPPWARKGWPTIHGRSTPMAAQPPPRVGHWQQLATRFSSPAGKSPLTQCALRDMCFPTQVSTPLGSE